MIRENIYWTVYYKHVWSLFARSCCQLTKEYEGDRPAWL